MSGEVCVCVRRCEAGNVDVEREQACMVKALCISHTSGSVPMPWSIHQHTLTLALGAPEAGWCAAAAVAETRLVAGVPCAPSAAASSFVSGVPLPPLPPLAPSIDCSRVCSRLLTAAAASFFRGCRRPLTALRAGPSGGSGVPASRGRRSPRGAGGSSSSPEDKTRGVQQASQKGDAGHEGCTVSHTWRSGSGCC